MPSLEYSKRNLLVEGLNVVLTANYNRNSTVNVDTARYQYNWLGERHELNSPGEQSYQYTRSDNDNWNGTLTANYNIGQAHLQRALPLCRLRRDLLLAQAGRQRQSAHTDLRQSVYAPFLLYPEIFGSVNDFYVPNQFAHNLTLSYSMKEGRYNFSLECRNFTNEKLYDNFSLQKAGRAFYAKFRVSLGG